MKDKTRSRTQALFQLRKNHPAWQLLNARTGPLILGVLRDLFEEHLDGIEQELAHQMISEALELFRHNGEIEPEGDSLQLARREVRGWIRRGLLVERENRLIATDALEAAFRFVDALDNRIMTSTASRLSIVQREIDELANDLNPDQGQREARIRRRIEDAQRELAAVRRGEVRVLPEQQALERIRELYSLAMSLRNDFRRVEDSYREADQQLRQSIIGEQSHRGEIVDSLLHSQQQLLETDEGRVFDAFQQQLNRSLELDDMHGRIRDLTDRPVARKALDVRQWKELRLLKMNLVYESGVVIRARQRTERDVKGFLKTGLASEHHRVGQLLNDLFAEAALIDWQPQSVRRAPSPLPPVGIANSSLPLAERLRFKDQEQEIREQLDLMEQQVSLDELDEDYWSAFDALDRQALLEETRQLLAQQDHPLTVARIAEALRPRHDLEALALWLVVAMEAEIPTDERIEQLELEAGDGTRYRFTLPRVELDGEVLDGIELDL